MASVIIADHQRVYSDTVVSVSGATLTLYDDGTAIASGDLLYVYYDDIDRLGGEVVLMATKSAGNAITSGNNPARHYVGSVMVPSSGTAVGVPVYPSGISSASSS